MAIEFRCPECNALVRTPDTAAGKKGKCPTCSVVVQIPSESPSSTSPRTSAAILTPEGKIEFRCSNCTQPVRVPGTSAGKKGRCPHCQTILDIPRSSAVATTGPVNRSAAAPTASPVEFQCPLCAKLVKTPASAAGKKGKCPHCQGVVEIPRRSTASSGGSPAASGGSGAVGPIEFPCPRCNHLVKTPGSAAGKMGKCPKCQGVVEIPMQTPQQAPASSGLTFLPEPQPLGNDTFGGLTPLDSFGGGSLSDDPFADLGASAPALRPPGSKSANPYAAPSAASFSPKAQPARARGAARSGLPWDNRKSGKAKSPFISTIKLILFEPTKAFQMMRREGGLSDPIAFAFMGNLIGNLATSVYLGILLIVMFAVAGGEGGDATELGMTLGKQFSGSFIQAGARATLGMFISAGIIHLLLMIVKGANYEYEATFRTLAYVDGALAFAQVIPCVGSLVMLVGVFVINIIALMNSQETSGGKASFAVLAPLLLCLACGIGVVLMMMGVIGAIAAGSG